jgi:hypothetical protein
MGVLFRRPARPLANRPYQEIDILNTLQGTRCKARGAARFTGGVLRFQLPVRQGMSCGQASGRHDPVKCVTLHGPISSTRNLA